MFDPKQQETQSLLEAVIENISECIVVTDTDGYIRIMNRAYREFVGKQDVIGRHVTEVIENTRMHLVAQTGQPELADIHRINGQDMIANRIPMLENGKVVAVIGTVLFQDVSQVHALAATLNQLKQELAYYKRELRLKLGSVYHFDQIISSSPVMHEVKSLAQKVARSNTTVLITGESGTGKELFAHAIHSDSHRQMGPFIRVNCAAIPDALLESELFGYDEGAFTGALRKGKKGKFELADHGTILLDEIGDMPLSLQVKLLRVLQEKEVERVGGMRPISIDVRVIASTNCDLLERIKEGKFREDLYYRLNVVTLEIPPLRERMEDLPKLVRDLLEQLMESTGKIVTSIEQDVWDVLEDHSWPGNVRELRNKLERALHVMDGDCLKAEHFLIRKAEKKAATVGVRTLKESLERAERKAIVQALAHTKGNRLEAAKLLGISKSGLYQKLEKHGISDEEQ
ncbi:MAG: sigma-54 interaction domain-containing protein [Tumebacillaceae bacterium]